jgi:sodium-coupled neutral amino acid transporter 11
MFKNSPRSRPNVNSVSEEHRQPLLHSREDLNDETLFTADDDFGEELEGTSALGTPKTSRGTHNVTFKEDAQLIAPPLRSTTSSRETRQLLHLHQQSSILS